MIVPRVESADLGVKSVGPLGGAGRGRAVGLYIQSLLDQETYPATNLCERCYSSTEDAGRSARPSDIQP